ncbi:MAG: esterase family protein [Methylococcaceae bacterium]|nr:esterase family protein [Methylococcaceae bacterium]
MNREYHRWHSPHLGRHMELLVFGHSGAKVLIFPTRNGRFFEYENLGLVKALAHKIQAGHIQLYCVDSIDNETFYCRWRHPSERIQRYMHFEEYILTEVLPFMVKKNPNPCTIIHGCSLGAFHAANMAFRHPKLFHKLCAFSGRYDLTMSVDDFHDLFDGYYDENIYFNTPTHFLPQLSNPSQLKHLRRMDMVFTIGKEDPFLGNNHHLSQILSSKDIRHSMFEWDGRAHRGCYWRKMVSLYI